MESRVNSAGRRSRAFDFRRSAGAARRERVPAANAAAVAMSFFVDIVSEDSFYENLTLGVSRLLEANPCVRNVQLERRGACDRAALSTWEQKHCCLLTEDLRNFYTSTDGFLLTWSLEIAGEEFAIGRMEIKELASLKRYAGGGSKEQPQQRAGSGREPREQHTCSGREPREQHAASGREKQQRSDLESELLAGGDVTRQLSVVEPTFGGSRCKLFELADCGSCRVFLAYQLQPDQDEPSVWFYCASTSQWHLLADSFAKYFRMMLVHLGLPMWQVCAAGLRLPTWLEQVYLLVGPHLLPDTMPSAATSTSAQSILWNDGPINVIDPSVFRGKEHHHGGGGGVRHKPSGGNAPTTSTSGPAAGNARKKSSSH